MYRCLFTGMIHLAFVEGDQTLPTLLWTRAAHTGRLPPQRTAHARS